MSDVIEPEQDLYGGMALDPPPEDFPQEMRRDRYGRAYAFRDGTWYRDPQWDNGAYCDVGFERHEITLALGAHVVRTVNKDQALLDQKLILRGARSKTGLSQDQLAALCGVSQPTWSLYERGLRLASHEFMARVAAESSRASETRPQKQRRSSGRTPREPTQELLDAMQEMKRALVHGSPTAAPPRQEVDWLAEEARANGATEPTGEGGAPE